MTKSSSYQAGQVLKNAGNGKRSTADQGVSGKPSKVTIRGRVVVDDVPDLGGDLRVESRKVRIGGKAPKAARRGETTVLVALSNGVDIEIAGRADVVARALGSRTKLAQFLKVSPSQPTRWIKGEEAPNSENTRTIVDLEHVVTRARLLWGDDEVVNAWLTGRNGFLDGARPIDVIATQGSGPVIDALDQATAGAFA